MQVLEDPGQCGSFLVNADILCYVQLDVDRREFEKDTGEDDCAVVKERRDFAELVQDCVSVHSFACVAHVEEEIQQEAGDLRFPANAVERVSQCRLIDKTSKNLKVFSILSERLLPRLAEQPPLVVDLGGHRAYTNVGRTYRSLFAFSFCTAPTYFFFFFSWDKKYKNFKDFIKCEHDLRSNF